MLKICIMIEYVFLGQAVVKIQVVELLQKYIDLLRSNNCSSSHIEAYR